MKKNGFYTRSDNGLTDLLYGKRVLKNDARIEAYGALEEANSLVGLSHSHLMVADFDEKDKFSEWVHQIQSIIFKVSSEILIPKGETPVWMVSKDDVLDLEIWIDELVDEINLKESFVLPGGHSVGASLHAARAVVRRAERSLISIDEDINTLLLAYINRLSDFLYVAAQYVNYKLGNRETVFKDE